MTSLKIYAVKFVLFYSQLKQGEIKCYLLANLDSPSGPRLDKQIQVGITGQQFICLMINIQISFIVQDFSEDKSLLAGRENGDLEIQDFVPRIIYFWANYVQSYKVLFVKCISFLPIFISINSNKNLKLWFSSISIWHGEGKGGGK